MLGQRALVWSLWEGGRRKEEEGLGKDRHLQKWRGSDDRQEGRDDGLWMADPNFLSKIGGKVICWKEAGSLMRMGNVGNSCGKASVRKAMKEILSSWRTHSDDTVCETHDLLVSEPLFLSYQIHSEQGLPLLPKLAYWAPSTPKGKRNIVDSLLKGQRTQTIVPKFLKQFCLWAFQNKHLLLDFWFHLQNISWQHSLAHLDLSISPYHQRELFSPSPPWYLQPFLHIGNSWGELKIQKPGPTPSDPPNWSGFVTGHRKNPPTR